MDEEIIEVDCTPLGMEKRRLKRIVQELDRLPIWVLNQQGFSTHPDIGRPLCSQNHLFVNGQSKYCHICGEER